MKFADKFTDMKYLEVEEGIIMGKNPVPCHMCQEPTVYIDLCSEAPFCSEECMEKFYIEMDEYIKGHPDYSTDDGDIFGELKHNSSSI